MERTGERRSDRRGVLVAAAALVAVYGGLRWWNGRSGAPVYEDLADVPGFRRVQGGAVSRPAFDPLVGLDTGRPAPPPIPREALCTALFTAAGPGVPVAYFTDYFCPYCRVLSRLLADRQADGRIALTVHQTPLLGEASDAAARAVLAARAQGGGDAVSRRLERSRLLPTAGYLREMAAGIGLDGERLLADMQAAPVEGELAQARALAATFGFGATPAMVIGRTAVLGAVDEDRLDRLIAAEAADPGRACAG